jgi:hypothetical protein
MKMMTCPTARLFCRWHWGIKDNGDQCKRHYFKAKLCCVTPSPIPNQATKALRIQVLQTNCFINSTSSFYFHLASTTSKCLKYLVLLLNFGPHVQNTHGIGTKATAMKPSRLAAHANPSRSIICTVKSGKLDEMVNRMNVEAARTLAP